MSMPSLFWPSAVVPYGVRILPCIGHWNCGAGAGGGAGAAAGASGVGVPVAAGLVAAAVFCSVAAPGGGSASRFTAPGGPLGGALDGALDAVDEAVSVASAGGTYFAPGTCRLWPALREYGGCSLLRSTMLWVVT